MRVIWKDLVVTDYEQSFSTASTYVHWLYGKSHIAAPRILLGWRDPLGVERRPGVVDTPVEFYDCFMGELKIALTSASGVDALTKRYINCANSVRNQLRRSHDNSRVAAVMSLESELISLMAFHILNWAMPSDEAIEMLTQVLGDEVAAHACFLGLVNEGTSHLLHNAGIDEVLDARRRVADDRRTDALATALLSAHVRRLPAQVIQNIQTIRRAWQLAMREEEERKTLQADALRLLESREREPRWS